MFRACAKELGGPFLGYSNATFPKQRNFRIDVVVIRSAWWIHEQGMTTTKPNKLDSEDADLREVGLLQLHGEGTLVHMAVTI